MSDVSTTSTVKPDGTEVILVSIRYMRRDGDAFRWAVRHVRVTVPYCVLRFLSFHIVILRLQVTTMYLFHAAKVERTLQKDS